MLQTLKDAIFHTSDLRCGLLKFLRHVCDKFVFVSEKLLLCCSWLNVRTVSDKLHIYSVSRHGEDYIMKSFMPCTSRQILLGL